MLKLKKIEIQGFKSFADRTEMRFHGSGVAAVVGPNGCGKSNLSDAISWALGEQSAKSLRGARMEDVIFAGTRDRKPLGMASVTMTLTDPRIDPSPINVEVIELPPGADIIAAAPTGNIPSDKPDRKRDIVITRRLFRSGESEYLIDGKAARLRDIQDIFMGSGLGPESYAIIEQGRIGQILSSRPHDRRAVIEEAAGITRFKTKRRLAEAKLEGAKANLSRVFDILEEVGRQVNSLKRQAAKAKRWEELKTEMVAHLRRLLAGKFKTLDRDATKASLELQMASAALTELVTEVQLKEKEQSSLQEEFYKLEQDLTEKRKLLSEYRVDAERTSGRIQTQAQQIAAIEQRLGQGEAESQNVEMRLGRLAEEALQNEQSLKQLETETESARQRLALKNEERTRLEQDLRGREGAIEQARREVLRLLGESSTLRNQLAQVDEYLASTDRDRARAQKEEEISCGELVRIEGSRKEMTDRVASRQMELESLVDRRKGVESTLGERKQLMQESRRQLDQFRNEVSRLKARKDSLAEILSHRAYTTESVKRLFTAVERGQAQDLKPAGVLADFVEVDPTYEKAAEEFLHDELEYVVVHHWHQAESGIDLMRGDLDGRATFLVHPEPGSEFASMPTKEPAIGPETGLQCRLSDVLKMTNGLTKAPAELLPRLARCYLASDRASAQRLAVQYPDLYFLLADGVCYHGHAVSGGRKTGSGPLALKRELREVSGLWATRNRQMEGTTVQIEELELEIHRLSEDLEQLRQSQQKEEKEALALDHETRKLNEELARTNQRLSVARLELERLARESERALAQRETNHAAIAQREQGRQAQELALEAARALLSELQSGVSRVVEDHSVLRVEMASLDERRRSEAQVRDRLEGQRRDATRRKEELSVEMDRLGVNRARLLADNIEMDMLAQRLAEQVTQTQGEVSNLAGQDEKMRAALSALDEALKQRRSGLESAHENKSRIELELVRLQSDLKHLEETGRKELNCSPQELMEAEPNELDEDALTAAETQYMEVRGRIEALGAVNPQALEEYNEAQQRYDFLNTQRQDLLDSIRDTEKAIQEIDVESRKRFQEAFEHININFREMFKTLFGGGTGEMRLTDESNVGESGIEMVASPPGKRLQNVLLLSGGEKSLTAMALLMAIFKYQPSPFCILDEVDAPLDEANTARLAKLLKEMAGDTQFIVITHAKRTMEAAGTMYGVTMEEPGVSKLVSVKFNAAPIPVSEPKAMAAHAN